MTKIILHGILAKEFGDSFEMDISRPKDAIKAINANFINFENRIRELALEGLNYIIIVDNKKIQDIKELEIKNKFKTIEIVPLIFGAGAVAIGTFVLTSVASLGGAAAAAGMAAFLATSAGFLTSALVGGLILAAVTIGLQMLMAPKGEKLETVKSSTTAIKESFSFSNKANVANQGSVIPIGYGRLKVGSQVIQYTVKSYQSQVKFSDFALKANDNTVESVSSKQ
jgi:predicted phage tail protein